MQKLGYGLITAEDKGARATCHTCETRRILIDQLKQVYIDGELETTDTTNWFPRLCEGLHRPLTGRGSGPDPIRFSTCVTGAWRAEL